MWPVGQACADATEPMAVLLLSGINFLSNILGDLTAVIKTRVIKFMFCASMNVAQSFSKPQMKNTKEAVTSPALNFFHISTGGELLGTWCRFRRT